MLKNVIYHREAIESSLINEPCKPVPIISHVIPRIRSIEKAVVEFSLDLSPSFNKEKTRVELVTSSAFRSDVVITELQRGSWSAGLFILPDYIRVDKMFRYWKTK